MGIWIVWIALVYLTIIVIKDFLLEPLCGYTACTIKPIAIVFSAAFLLLRRLEARMFCSIALSFLLCDSVERSLPMAGLLSVLGFFSLLINRRWFDDVMPKIE